jgi:hypothetical protein
VIAAWTFSPWVAAKNGIGFQPMVGVRRDVDRYSDRISKSEAISSRRKSKIASLLLNRLRRCSWVHERIG